MPRLSLYFLGPPRVQLNGATLKLQYRKNLALIAYLCVTGESHTREALITLLWPELEPDRARSNLRRNLSMLRRALGTEWLAIERDTIGLVSSTDLWSDLGQFRDSLGKCREHGHSESNTCLECLGVLA